MYSIQAGFVKKSTNGVIPMILDLEYKYLNQFYKA